MKSSRILSVIAAFTLMLTPLTAQALTKDDIVNMSNIGVADSVIVSAIQASDTVFRLTPAEIIELTKNGVSQAVIEAMQKTAAGKAAPGSTPSDNGSGTPGGSVAPSTSGNGGSPSGDGGAAPTDPPPRKLPAETKSGGTGGSRPADTVQEIRRPQQSPANPGTARPQPNKVKALPADVKTLKERYRQGKYNTSADMAFDLLTGPNKDRFADHRSTIYFYLGSSLFQLKLYHSAHDIFLTVAKEGAADENYSRALAMLDKTSKRLKEFEQFAEVLEGAATTDLPRTARSTLLYLIGLQHYEKQDFEDARRALEGVEDSTSTYASALFLDGMSLYRQGNYREAVRRFKKLVEAPELVGTPEEIQEVKDLALLNMARVYYRVENFEAAKRLYGQIPHDSPQWPQALYEGAYTHFWLADYNVTLGDIMTIDSPFFAGSLYLPEAQILKALTYFNLCGYDKVGAVVKSFQDYHKPIRDNIRKFLGMYQQGLKFGDPGIDETLAARQASEAYNTLYVSKSRRAALGIPEEILVALQRQREFTNRVHHLEMIKQEIFELTDGSVRRKGTALGRTLLKKLNDDQLLLRQEAGKVMLKQLERIEKDLSGLIGESDIIAFEVVNAQKEEYEEKFRNPEKIETYEDLEANYATESTFIFWPFTGEYWEDELGSYRFTERGACRTAGKE